MKPLRHAKQFASVGVMALFLGSAANQAQGSVILGVNDQFTPSSPANGSLTVSGELSVMQGLDFGTTTGNQSAVALMYFPDSKQSTFDATEQAASFLWRDNVAEPKLLLDGANIMSLYNGSGAAVGLTLNPNASTVTFSGTDGGLRHASGGSILRFGASGSPVFDLKPTFGQGADFGIGGTLDAGKVGYLQGMLTGFGYQQDLNATPIAKLDISGVDIQITDIAAIYNSGAYYCVGHYMGSARIGSTNLPLSEGKRSGFCATVSISGNPAVRVFSGTSDIRPTSVAVGAYGVVVGGSFLGTTTSFPEGMNVTSWGGEDGFVSYYYSEVDQWVKTVSGSGHSTVTTVGFQQGLSQGDYVVAGGNFTGAIEFSGTDSHSLTSVSGQDGFIIGYEQDPSVNDATIFRQVGGTGTDSITDIGYRPGVNHLAVSGTFSSNISILGVGTLIRAGSQDGFVMRLDPWGVIAWIKPFGGINQDDVRSVEIDSSGNIYCTGSFTGTTTNFGSGKNITSLGGVDGFAMRLAASTGSVNWARQIGGTGSDNLACGSLDNSGDLVAGGTFSGTITSGVPHSLTSLGYDGLMVRFDGLTGVVESIQPIASAGSDAVLKIASSGSNLLACGGLGLSAALGDTRLGLGAFAFRWLGFDISTSPPQAPTPLQWGGGIAEGSASVALGASSYASGSDSFSAGGGFSAGLGSTALGTNTRATGNHSTSFGNGTHASGESSTAMGQSNSALGDYSTASGAYSTAQGDYSTAFGVGNSAYGQGSSAFGMDSYATGQAAVAFGQEAGAMGLSSIAMGAFVSAQGDYSLATGLETFALGFASASFGERTFAEAYASLALGAYNLGGGEGGEWIELDPLFEVGNGDGWSERSNAVTILKNGQTTLINKAWKANPAVAPTTANSNGEALVVEGNTRLRGTVVLEQRQGDISMGIYE